MRLSRDLQRQMLDALASEYPATIYNIRERYPEVETHALIANVCYLQEHGLIDGGYKDAGMLGREEVENSFVDHGTRITHTGLDFIADDGGLGAILNTVTVRVDTTQFAEMLAAKVDRLPISQEERSTIAGELRKLPAKSAEKVFEKMLDWAVDHAQDALPLLRTLLPLAST